MKAEELRIGNKVSIYGNIATVVRNDFEKWWDEETMSYKNLKPIPLTEEWLLKFGFEKYKDINAWHKSYIKLDKFFDGVFEYFTDPIIVRVKYVHQLQNLYYSLIGEELKASD